MKNLKIYGKKIFCRVELCQTDPQREFCIRVSFKERVLFMMDYVYDTERKKTWSFNEELEYI